MSKPKERNELEYLRAENRRIKSENRHLKKLLGKSDKKIKAYEDHVDMSEEAELEEPIAVLAPRCVEKGCDGELEIVDLGIRTMHVCRSCGNRKTIKK